MNEQTCILYMYHCQLRELLPSLPSFASPRLRVSVPRVEHKPILQK
jgi:hypothetical protein